MVGQALCRRLKREECAVLKTERAALDCRNQKMVDDWMHVHKPDAVIIAAARVGGIMANAENPADFFYDNMMIAANIIHSAYAAGVEKLLFLGSSCIYPREAKQPITEDMMLSSALEPTNEAYALAKIGGLKMAQYYRAQHGCDFISAMPCNLFGVGDTYDEHNSHVIPAMIMKAHQAKTEGVQELTLWGTGAPLREFLYVDDLADGLVFLLQNYSDTQHINIGAGQEVSIQELAKTVCEIIGFKGRIVFDDSKPDGTPRKLLDNTRLRELGWSPSRLNESKDGYLTYLRTCIAESYQDFQKNINHATRL